MSSKEIYVSTDVEADGPIPGPNSMLSFGSAAYTGGKELIGTFRIVSRVVVYESWILARFTRTQLTTADNRAG
jgi:hypothetical protein